MKTHTARWLQTSLTSWLLKARAQDGGAVLATICEHTGCEDGYLWQLGAVGSWARWEATRRAAQRAARKALEEAAQ